MFDAKVDVINLMVVAIYLQNNRIGFSIRPLDLCGCFIAFFKLVAVLVLAVSVCVCVCGPAYSRKTRQNRFWCGVARVRVMRFDNIIRPRRLCTLCSMMGTPLFAYMMRICTRETRLITMLRLRMQNTSRYDSNDVWLQFFWLSRC